MFAFVDSYIHSHCSHHVFVQVLLSINLTSLLSVSLVVDCDVTATSVEGKTTNAKEQDERSGGSTLSREVGAGLRAPVCGDTGEQHSGPAEVRLREYVVYTCYVACVHIVYTY